MIINLKCFWYCKHKHSIRVFQLLISISQDVITSHMQEYKPLYCACNWILKYMMSLSNYVESAAYFSAFFSKKELLFNKMWWKIKRCLFIQCKRVPSTKMTHVIHFIPSTASNISCAFTGKSVGTPPVVMSVCTAHGHKAFTLTPFLAKCSGH